MDSSFLLIISWLFLTILAAAGGVAQTVAGSVRLLKPLFYSDQGARVNRLNLWGGVFSAVGLAGGDTVAVLWIFQIYREIGIIALGVAMSTVLIFAVRELARLFARSRIDRLAYPLLGDTVALIPLVEPATTHDPSAPQDETIEQMVDAGAKAGLIESDEHQMISGVFRLDKTNASDIMVPRIDVVAVQAELPLREALDIVIAGAHSRVPVYEETIDHIIGLLYAKDLLKTLRDARENISLRDLLRPVRFVPEAKRLDELLQELQSSQVHMAIVVDEYGGTAGIVTIEDILEEIVGEIQDEYDTHEEPWVERVSEIEAIVNARATVEQLNELLSLALPTESDTVAGLVYQKLEKMPKVGDRVRVEDVEIVVEGVLGRRIKKVRVRKMIEPEKPARRKKQKANS